MKKLILLLSMLIFIPGCGNLSPRQDQDIENEGQINQLENMANSMKAEIMKLQAQNEILNSQIKQMQQGFFNQQNDNSGIQIFSGPGGLMVSICSIVAVSFLAYHYRRQSQINEQAAEIMAMSIAEKCDPDLEESVFRSVMYTDSEGKVLDLMKKHSHLI